MFCSRSVPIHLLRGGAALALLVVAVWLSAYALLGSALVVMAAFLLLRGCPMCWLIGLLQTIKQARSR